MSAEKRRVSDQVPSSAPTVRLFVVAAVALCAMTITAVVVLAIFVPQNQTIVATVVGITSSLTGLLSLGAYLNVAKTIDGKMSELIQRVGREKKLEGLVEGLEKNPNTNV